MKLLRENKIKNIAIITARAGSRRIKNKNIKIFNGKPIIYYTIKTLQKSKIFDKIFVSTNCKKTIKISKNLGIEDFIFRSDYFNKDKVGTISVINYCLKKLKKKKINPLYICCHYPASPLTNYKNILLAYNEIKKRNVNFIFPVTKLFKEKLINKKILKIEHIKKKQGIVNKKFLDAGQFWYAKIKTWNMAKSVYDKKSKIILTDLIYSDINTMQDWKNVNKVFLKVRRN